MVVLSTLVAILDSFGIIMLFPILSMILDSQSIVNTNIEWLNDFFDYLNVLGFNQFQIFIFMLTVFFLKSLLLYASALYAVDTRAFLLRNMKEKIYGAVANMPYINFIEGNTGERINIITEQVNKSLGLFTNFNKVLAMTSLAIFPVMTAVYISPKIGFSAIIIFTVLGLIFQLLNKRIRAYSKILLVGNTKLSKAIVQNYQNFKYLRCTGSQDTAIKDFLHKLNITVLTSKKIGNIQALSSSFREILIIFTLTSLVYLHIELLGGLLSEIIVVLFLLYRGVNALVNVQLTFQKVLESSAPLRMVYLNASKSPMIKKSDKIPTNFQSSNFSKIQFHNVCYSYSQLGNKILSDINLIIEAKCTYGVLGKSGSGKTTLVDLLLGLVTPTSGSVEICTDSGQYTGNCFEFLKVGYITQDPIVLDTSLRENILFFSNQEHRDNSDAQIIEVLENCGLSEFLNSINFNLDFQIGERGAKLSGGIKQRLSIARELFRKPDILVLDEATSALDEQSENVIRETLTSIKGSCTIIIITHKPKFLSVADTIFNVENTNVIYRSN